MERFSRMLRSGLAMVLALCMIVSACPVAAFAAEDEINYVSLGDSMTNGFCFTGYAQGEGASILTGNGMYGNAAYPNQFATWLAKDGATVNHTKLAPSGMRAEELNYLLGGREMPTDSWGIEQLENYSGVSDHAKLKKLFQDSITEADVITVGVGNASFGAYMVQYFTRLMGVMGSNLPDVERVDLEKALVTLEPAQKTVVMNAYNQMLAEAKKYAPFTELVVGDKVIDLQDLIDLMAYVSVGFILNYEGALDRIVALNPNAEVILVGLMNTTDGMVITGEGFDPIPVGDIVDTMFNALNAYIAGLPAVKHAAGEWKDAKFYYAAQPNPEFIVEVFGAMADAGWPADYNGLSGTTVRARTIKAYNNNLREMIGAALGFELPTVDIVDVRDFICDNDYSFDSTFETKWMQELNQIKDNELLQKYAQGYEAYGDYAAWAGYSINKQISIAIYQALEEALAKTVGTMEITLDGLMGIAGDILGALGEMPEALTQGPKPITIKNSLVDWFTGSETARAMCKIFAMFKVGDGMSVHPTPAAHNKIAGSVISAYANNHTAEEETKENIKYILGELKGFLETYGPEAAAQLVKIWNENGYQTLVDGYVTELEEIVTARYEKYTNEVLPAITTSIDTLTAQKDALTTELTTLKAQLAEKKAELEKVISEQEIGSITPPDFSIDTELGNNEQTQVPENDCEGAGNVADELAAAVADLEHAIAVIEALIADVTADIEDMVALATEIAEAVASLEKTVADVAAAAQDLKEAFDAVYAVLTDEKAQAASQTFINAFNTARAAALTAAEALELIIDTVNEDAAAIEESVNVLTEGMTALYNKLAEENVENVLMQVLTVLPEDVQAIIGASALVIQQTLEANKAEILKGLDAAKQDVLTKLDADKQAVLTKLATDLGALKTEYQPHIDAALKELNDKKAEIQGEIDKQYQIAVDEANAQIDALKQEAQGKIDDLKIELQGYVDQLNGLADDVADDVRAGIQAQIDRITGDIATITADLDCAIEHVNAELKAVYDAIVKDVNDLYQDIVTELQNALDDLQKAYDDAVKDLQDAADKIIKDLQDEADKIIKDLQDAADKAIQDLIDAANKELEKLGKLGEILSDVLDGIFDAIRDDIANAQKAIADILSGALDAVKDLGDSLVDMGIDAVNALVDQITDLINDLLYQATHSDLELNEESLYIALGDGSAAPESYAEELAAQLEAQYGVKNFENYAKTGNTVSAETAKVAKRDGIADADLITIGFSNVDMLANAMNNLRTEPDWAEVVGEENVGYVEDILADVNAEIVKAIPDESISGRVSRIVEWYAYNAVEYAIELPGLVSEIRTVNEDGVIVIVGMYNPMEDVIISIDGSDLDITEYVNYLVKGVAVHGTAYALISGDAIYVDAPDVDVNKPGTIWDKDMLLDLIMFREFGAMYPGEEGDVYIANQILGALNITKIPVEVKGLWGDANDDGKVNLADAILILKRANNHDVAINETLSDVTGDGKINLADAIRVLKRANNHPDLFPVEQ